MDLQIPLEFLNKFDSSLCINVTLLVMFKLILFYDEI